MSPAARPSPVEDELGDEVARIDEWLAEHQLKAVPAWMKAGPAAVTVHWTGESEEDVPDWKTFLTQAKALEAPFVARRVQRLTEEELEGESWGASDGEVLESPEIRALFERTRGHIGEVGAVELQWIAPAYNGVLFSLELSADWFDEFYAREDASGDRGTSEREFSPSELKKLAKDVAYSAEYELCTDYGERQEVVRSFMPSEMADNDDEFHKVMGAAADIFEKDVLPKLQKSPEVTELSLKLANDSRFQRASNQQARRYAAEQLLPQDIINHGPKFKLILERARTIYDVDIRKGGRPSHK